MLVVECSGTPMEIGLQHGTQAKVQVHSCIEFYKRLFLKASKLEWPKVQEIAYGFGSTVKSRWPDYYEEMRGIAEGSGVSVLDILALNIRTEIAFGKFSDGCTALSLNTEKHGFLAQNWDWNPEQKRNLVIMKINSPKQPAIQMVTEAGIIGKIGFNSNGVGVLLNAIRAEGMDPTRLPVHLALRSALESQSAREALAQLEACGMASPAHILIADATEAFGCEFTSKTAVAIRPDEKNRIVHTNHLLLDHPGVVDTAWLKDSPFRLKRMTELSSGSGESTFEEVSDFFKDRENAPAAICRSGDIETLFNIVMDLKQKRAVVTLGMPTNSEGSIELGF
ncbi:acyl-coenzyme A:6-aminopenicillanic acid acyl-transferase-domain-containing protein [Xylariaceae sp. FL0255]|nr:acyl-coenzyme A:6-aminopenicillanic acid acyl-transferase-domain-containing protein [Xylariaceae sp. FL0255]